MKKITIGRTPDNTIVFNEPTVSGHHATLMVEDNGSMTLTDHSTNGTMVNGRKIKNETVGIHAYDDIRFPGGNMLDMNKVLSDSSSTVRIGQARSVLRHRFPSRVRKLRPRNSGLRRPIMDIRHLGNRRSRHRHRYRHRHRHRRTPIKDRSICRLARLFRASFPNMPLSRAVPGGRSIGIFSCSTS